MTEPAVCVADSTPAERLWWIVVAAINRGLDEDLAPVIEALRLCPGHEAPTDAALALRLWRLERSPRAVEQLERLMQDESVSDLARAFLALIQLETERVGLALANLAMLAKTPDERARYIAHAVFAAAGHRTAIRH